MRHGGYGANEANVDDYQYPPQKKSFSALRFVVNHYSGKRPYEVLFDLNRF